VTKSEDSPVVIESLDQFEISPIRHAISVDLLQKRTAWVVGRANWAMVELARRSEKMTAWRPTLPTTAYKSGSSSVLATTEYLDAAIGDIGVGSKEKTRCGIGRSAFR
jgi:hypothetical protein